MGPVLVTMLPCRISPPCKPRTNLLIFYAVTSGDDYVYHPSTELFNALEDFCDEQTIHEPRQPLLVTGDAALVCATMLPLANPLAMTGEHGTGKSALLANWLQRRQRAGPRGESLYLFCCAMMCYTLCCAALHMFCLLLSPYPHRLYAPIAGRGGDEFIFWHAVGSSRKSMEIHNLIRR